MSNSGQAGFTLFELLIVMAILSLTATAAFMWIGPASGRQELKVTAARLASLIRDTRTHAMRYHQTADILVDVGHRQIRALRSAKSVELPQDVDIFAEVGETVKNSGGVGLIRFYPSGASTGGRLRLVGKQASYELFVNWFTGQVRFDRTAR